MMPVWLPLWQLVGSSNSFAILFVVIAIVTMVVYLFRSKPGMATSCVHISDPAEMELTYQSTPFMVTINECTETMPQTLESGIKTLISARRSYHMMHIWGCNIDSFHRNMTRDWKDIQKEIVAGSFLKEDSLWCSKPELSYELQREILLKPEMDITAASLGSSPRSKFPLVVAIVLNEDDGEGDPKLTDAVSLISAIHVKDTLCTSGSSIVFKLSKMCNGQVLNVTNLFTRGTSEDAAICLVCENHRVTIGLLPCRHFSLCESCYSMLPNPKQCPVCRSYVTRFFRHRSNETDETVEPNETVMQPDPDGQSTSRIVAAGSTLVHRMTRVFVPAPQ